MLHKPAVQHERSRPVLRDERNEAPRVRTQNQAESNSRGEQEFLVSAFNKF
jgi:hypothetical protein